MASSHLSPSRKIVYQELKSNPGRRYRRSEQRLRELAAEYRLDVQTLDQSLVDLASRGYISKSRMGRNMDYFCRGDDDPTRDETIRNGAAIPYRYTVTYEADEDGYVIASVPALPGCHSQGHSIEEARQNIKEAMRGYLASLQYRGDPPPRELSSEVLQVTL